jgi:TusA-related sulfurtransferase
VFGSTLVVVAGERHDVPRTDHLDTAAPVDRPTERLDVRELPPPEPLTRTLELLADLDDEVVLVQVNDRAPQHLFPQLEERGYEHDTVETDDGVVTTVWRE